ncbi:uncharacterized protein [Miscanthus floridulus]|uniref:uncharacterized protein n=1 Tax=Miscanthus floridulus TaxID=154761 RepID=UPI0034596BF6
MGSVSSDRSPTPEAKLQLGRPPGAASASADLRFFASDVVAELLPFMGTDKTDLRCFASDVGEWVNKRVRYPLPVRVLAPLRTLAHHGRLWWADYSWGVLTADPFADDPVLGFVPLPRPCVLKSREAWGVLDQLRYVGVSAGSLRFVDTYRRGGAPNKVTVWTLRDPDATEWTLEHQATFADVWADDTYKATGLPKTAPVLALIHPHNPAVVYSFLEDHLFAVDVPARKVVDCERYHLVAPPREYGIANRFVRDWELPRAISSVFCTGGVLLDYFIIVFVNHKLRNLITVRNSHRKLPTTSYASAFEFPVASRQYFLCALNHA